MFSGRRNTNSKPNPQTQCQVCRAARALVIAGDQYRTAEWSAGQGIEQDMPKMAAALQRAGEVWTATKHERHTGVEHEPMVAE